LEYRQSKNLTLKFPVQKKQEQPQQQPLTPPIKYLSPEDLKVRKAQRHLDGRFYGSIDGAPTPGLVFFFPVPAEYRQWDPVFLTEIGSWRAGRFRQAAQREGRNPVRVLESRTLALGSHPNPSARHNLVTAGSSSASSSRSSFRVGMR
jgi:hypothetical protein